MTSTEELSKCNILAQESILLGMIRDACSSSGDSGISPAVRGKVSRILTENQLAPHVTLHRFNTVDESSSTLLGLMQKTATELTYDEQSELNEAIIRAIQIKLPTLIVELNTICNNKLSTIVSKGGLLKQHLSREAQMRELTESIDDKLNTLKEQELEKVDLMMEWLNHRLSDVVNFGEDTADLYATKSKTLELKSKILHLQILQNIFTETNQSIKAYSEVHKDLKDSIKETERRIKEYKHIIQTD